MYIYALLYICTGSICRMCFSSCISAFIIVLLHMFVSIVVSVTVHIIAVGHVVCDTYRQLASSCFSCCSHICFSIIIFFFILIFSPLQMGRILRHHLHKILRRVLRSGALLNVRMHQAHSLPC